MAEAWSETRPDPPDLPDLPRRVRFLNRVARPVAPGILRIESHRLVTTAMRRTGLPDLGPPPFSAPLEILCRSLEREARLHPLGRLGADRELVALLSTRARLAHLWERRRGLADAPVPAPIVVMGLPGTGARFLLRLLARDPGLRSLPWWEARSPLPTRRPEEREASTTDRIGAAGRAVRLRSRVGPRGAPACSVDPLEPDGESALLALTFSSMRVECRWHVPTFAEWYDSADLHEGYAHLRRVLATLQWYRPAERWLLASAQHLERLPELLGAFPDAVLVQTHRDPAAVIPSAVAAICAERRSSTDSVDPDVIGRYWAWRTGRLLERNLTQRASVGDREIVDVTRDELLADPLAAVERINAAAGRATSDEASAAMSAYLATSPRDALHAARGRPGTPGLDAGDLGRRFARYRTTFRVRDE